MSSAPRKVAFVLAASEHGTLIVNRLDYYEPAPGHASGVGWQVLSAGNYDPAEVTQFIHLLKIRRAHFGDGIVAVDCGANIGVHTLEWARLMTGWGSVIAIEAQERVFYALAGNIVINNCLNARAINAAVGAAAGSMRVPVPDYLSSGSFGSLELRASANNEFIGQKVDYADAAMAEVPCITVDGLGLPRVDVLKIDVEGMELEVLAGAERVLRDCRPIVVVEHVKVGWGRLADRLLTMDYLLYRTPMNMIAVHQADPALQSIRQG